MKWLYIFVLLALLSCSSEIQGNAPTAKKWKDMGFRAVYDKIEVPEINFLDETGAALSLSDFRESVVLLNFWASWCPPCRAEMPAMERLAEKLEGTDFAMVPINVGESPDIIDAFMKEFNINFPIYYDESTEAAEMIGVGALPTSVFLDRDGSVVSILEGTVEWDSREIVSALRNWVN